MLDSLLVLGLDQLLLLVVVKSLLGQFAHFLLQGSDVFLDVADAPLLFLEHVDRCRPGFKILPSSFSLRLPLFVVLAVAVSIDSGAMPGEVLLAHFELLGGYMFDGSIFVQSFVVFGLFDKTPKPMHLKLKILDAPKPFKII